MTSLASLVVPLLLAQAEPPPASAEASVPAPASEAPYRISEVVVTGTRTEEKRKDATAAVEVIDRQTIEAAGAENVAQVLETHPGVELEPSFRGYTARIQGLDPEYVLVLVDGERVQGRLGGTIDLTRYATDNVERIEIVKGAGSALYGSDAVAGVINIITRRARRAVEAGGHLSGGTLGTLDGNARVGGRWRGFDGLLTVGHHRAASWDLTPDTVDTTGSAFTSSDVALAGGWRQDRFGVRARGQYMRRDQTGVGADAAGAVFDRKTLSEDASLTLEPEYRFAGGSRLHLTGHAGLFVDQFLSDQRGSSLLDQVQKTEENQLRGGAQLDLVMGSRNLLVTGAELLYEQMHSPRIAGGQTDRTRSALYAQHEFRWLDRPRLALLPGVRFDADSQFGFHASPKLAVRFDPHPTVVLRSSYGFAYRAPSFQELHLAFDNASAGYMVAGNPDLKPESSASLTAAAEWRPPLGGWGSDRVVLNAGLFRTDIRDLIIVRLTNPDQVGQLSRFSYANVADAHTQGFETGVGAELPAGFQVNLSYTFTAARDEEADRPLEGQARHRGTFRLGYRHAGIGLSGQARGSLVGSRPFYVDNDNDGVIETDDAGAYATLGVRLQQRVWRQFDAFLGADNLAGAGDENYLPVPPRTFYGGLDFTF